MAIYELDKFGFLALKTQSLVEQSYFDRFGLKIEDAWRNGATANNGQFPNGASYTQRNHPAKLS